MEMRMSDGDNEAAVEVGENAAAGVATANSWNDLEDFEDEGTFDDGEEKDEGELKVKGWGEEEEDDSEEEEDEEGEEEGVDDDSDGDEESGEEEDESSEASDEPAKQLTAVTRDGEELELAEDIKFQLKQNGKIEEVTLKDLKDNMAGRVAWQARIAEANRIKSEAETLKTSMDRDVTVLNNKIKKLHTAISAGKLEEGMAAMADLMRLNPKNFVGDFIRTVRDHAGQYAQMSDEHIENVLIHLENRHLISQREADEEERKLTGEYNNAVALRDKYQADFNLESGILKEAYELLVKNDPSIADRYTPSQAVEAAVRMSLDIRAFNNVKAAASSLKVELNDDDYEALIKSIVAVELNTAGGTDFTASDYKDLVKARKNGLTPKAKKNLKRKVKTSRKTTPKKVKRKEVDLDDAASIDDLWSMADA